MKLSPWNTASASVSTAERPEGDSCSPAAHGDADADGGMVSPLPFRLSSQSSNCLKSAAFSVSDSGLF